MDNNKNNKNKLKRIIKLFQAFLIYHLSTLLEYLKKTPPEAKYKL